MDGGTITTSGYFAFCAWRRGFLEEILSLIRFFGALALGYLLSPFAGEWLGFSGIIAPVIGFYTVFLGSFFGMGFLFRFLKPRDKSTTLPGRILGLALGAGEGILFFGLLGTFLSLVPLRNSTGLSSVANSPGVQAVRAVLGPLVPEEASGAAELITLARDLNKGIDPEMVDREAIARQLEPLRSNPAIRAVSEDPEIRQLLESRRFMDIARNPKVLQLLSDPDIRRLTRQVDLKSLADAIRKGIPPD